VILVDSVDQLKFKKKSAVSSQSMLVSKTLSKLVVSYCNRLGFERLKNPDCPLELFVLTNL
jgi:hypothetical protein